MIPLYRPGESVVHTMPVWLKFAVVFVAAATVSLNRENPWVIAAAWGLAAAGYLASGAGIGGSAAQLWRLRWLVVILTVPQLIFLDPGTALLNVSRVLAIVLLAALLTRTTRTSTILSGFEAALRPLERAGGRRIGLDAQRISLGLSLTIRSVPVVMGFYSEIREAQRARGVRVGPHRLIVPLLVMSLRHAEETAEALAARGVRSSRG